MFPLLPGHLTCHDAAVADALVEQDAPHPGVHSREGVVQKLHSSSGGSQAVSQQYTQGSTQAGQQPAPRQHPAHHQSR